MESENQQNQKQSSFMHSEAVAQKLFSPSALNSQLSQEKFHTSVHY